MPLFPVAIIAGGLWLGKTLMNDGESSSQGDKGTPISDKAKREALYEKYPVSEGEIRLLRVRPGSGLLRCEFIVQKLSSPLERDYGALSYVWGARTSSRHVVYIERVPFPVVDNLYYALKQFRESASGETIEWVDALCINQDSTFPEKNVQVRQMGRIFSLAKHVHVWLGRKTDWSDETVKTFRHVADRWANTPGEEWVRMWRSAPAVWNQLKDDFLDNIWWTRVWIIQEVMLHPNPMVFRGSEWLPFHFLLAASAIMTRNYLDSWGKMDETTPEFARGLSRSGLATFRGRQMQKHSIQFSEWVANFHGQGHTDPRDLVYAFLGLGEPPVRGVLTPRYEAPLETVLAEATKYIIQQSRSLDFICLGRGHGRGSPEEGGEYNNFERRTVALPTWVPDLRLQDGKGMVYQRRLPLNYGGGIQTRVFGASDNSSVYNASDEQFRGSWLADGTRMSCMGFSIDQVFDTTRPNLVNLDFTRDYLEGSVTSQFVRDARERLETITQETAGARKLFNFGNPKYPGLWKGSYDEAFNKTLMMDLRFDRSRLKPREHFSSLAERPPTDFMPDVADAGERGKLWSLHLHAERHTWTAGRIFFTTERGYIGVANQECKKGDSVCILDGATVPFVLSPVDGGEWQFIGESYLHGFMDGECKSMECDKKRFVIC